MFVMFGLGALLDSSVGPDLVCSCLGFRALLDSFVGQTLSVRFFVFLGGGALLDSFVDHILSWAIPSRRSKLLSNGKRNSVEWYCGVGFGDLIVGFFRGPDSVCSLFLDLKQFRILSWARPCLFVIFGLGCIADVFLSWGQTLSVLLLYLGCWSIVGFFRGRDSV